MCIYIIIYIYNVHVIRCCWGKIRKLDIRHDERHGTMVQFLWYVAMVWFRMDVFIFVCTFFSAKAAVSLPHLACAQAHCPCPRQGICLSFAPGWQQNMPQVSAMPLTPQNMALKCFESDPVKKPGFLFLQGKFCKLPPWKTFFFLIIPRNRMGPPLQRATGVSKEELEIGRLFLEGSTWRGDPPDSLVTSGFIMGLLGYLQENSGKCSWGFNWLDTKHDDDIIAMWCQRWISKLWLFSWEELLPKLVRNCYEHIKLAPPKI